MPFLHFRKVWRRPTSAFSLRRRGLCAAHRLNLDVLENASQIQLVSRRLSTAAFGTPALSVAPPHALTVGAMLSSSSRVAACSSRCSRRHLQQQQQQQRGRLLVAAAVKAKSARQVCCSKTLVARPEHRDAVKQLCDEVASFSAQRIASDRSCGIREFTVAADGWEDNVYHMWERYDSNVDLGRHNTSPQLEAFMRQVAPLLERPVGMALYEYRNGQLGPASMQSGPKGEGGLDDATGASGAAGGASYKQTSRAAQLSSLGEDDLEDGGGARAADDDADGAAAWWAVIGSQPAVAAALVGAAAVAAFAASRLVGH